MALCGMALCEGPGGGGKRLAWPCVRHRGQRCSESVADCVTVSIDHTAVVQQSKGAGP